MNNRIMLNIFAAVSIASANGNSNGTIEKSNVDASINVRQEDYSNKVSEVLEEQNIVLTVNIGKLMENSKKSMPKIKEEINNSILKGKKQIRDIEKKIKKMLEKLNNQK